MILEMWKLKNQVESRLEKDMFIIDVKDFLNNSTLYQ